MGINAGEYSRQLMLMSDEFAQQEEAGNPNPKRVLFKAVQGTTAKGSATVCICSLSNSDENGASLRGANLGDSGSSWLETPKWCSDHLYNNILSTFLSR